MESNSKYVERNDSDDRFHDDRAKQPKLYAIKRIEMLDSITNVIMLLRNQLSMWISDDLASRWCFVKYLVNYIFIYLQSIILVIISIKLAILTIQYSRILCQPYTNNLCVLDQISILIHYLKFNQLLVGIGHVHSKQPWAANMNKIRSRAMLVIKINIRWV